MRCSPVIKTNSSGHKLEFITMYCELCSSLYVYINSEFSLFPESGYWRYCHNCTKYVYFYRLEMEQEYANGS